MLVVANCHTWAAHGRPGARGGYLYYEILALDGTDSMVSREFDDLDPSVLLAARIPESGRWVVPMLEPSNVYCEGHR